MSFPFLTLLLNIEEINTSILHLILCDEKSHILDKLPSNYLKYFDTKGEPSSKSEVLSLLTWDLSRAAKQSMNRFDTILEGQPVMKTQVLQKIK